MSSDHDFDAELPVDRFIDTDLTELIYIQHFISAISEMACEHLHAIRDRARLGNTSPEFAAMVDELSEAVDGASGQASSHMGQALTDALFCMCLHLDRELVSVLVVKTVPAAGEAHA